MHHVNSPEAYLKMQCWRITERRKRPSPRNLAGEADGSLSQTPVVRAWVVVGGFDSVGATRAVEPSDRIGAAQSFGIIVLQDYDYRH